MTRRMYSPLTKKMMLDDIESVIIKFYGSQTKLSKRIARLPKHLIARLHEVMQLNREDSLYEQVGLIEVYAVDFCCQYEHDLQVRRERKLARMCGIRSVYEYMKD